MYLALDGTLVAATNGGVSIAVVPAPGVLAIVGLSGLIRARRC